MSELTEIRPEPGPEHQCFQALEMTHEKWNPTLADDMIQFGASHYLAEWEIWCEESEDGQSFLIVDAIHCIGCGITWLEREEYRDGKEVV